MSSISSALLVIPTGFRICITNSRVRALAIKPWLIGIVSYFFSLILAYYLHPVILSMLTGDSKSWFTSIIFYSLWFVISILLIMGASLLSMILVLISTAVFQTEIVKAVLSESHKNINEDSLLRETGRTIWVESTKLIWLIPLFITIFILGLIPFLTPFSIVANCWLIAYQFVDIVLDVFKKGTLERLNFARKNWFFLIAIGASLMLFWMIPFIGIFIPPIAVAGTAKALDNAKLLN